MVIQSKEEKKTCVVLAALIQPLNIPQVLLYGDQSCGDTCTTSLYHPQAYL